MTISNQYKELKFRIEYLCGSYLLTTFLFSYYHQDWLGWVFLPFYKDYPKVQWQYHYGLEIFYIFWKMTLIGSLIWLLPWILLQWSLYRRIGQWEKESQSLYKFGVIIIEIIIGYGIYFWGYKWIILGNYKSDLGILIQLVVSDMVSWFYGCILFPVILYGIIDWTKNLDIWKRLERYRHFYWLSCLLIGSFITPPDGLSQIFIFIISFMILEYQILKIIYRDVTKR